MTHDLFPPALRARLQPTGPVVPHPGAFATAPLPPTLDETIAQFTEACEAVGGRVSRLSDATEVADLVLGYLEARDWRHDDQADPSPFVAWDQAHLALPDVPALLQARGVEQLDTAVSTDPARRERDCQRLDRAIVGITGAHAALADTGSVALVHGAGRPRLASLLPPVHVAIVPVARLQATLGALLRDEPDLLRQAANVVFVTGPSRTADIEMTLTRGVHGPRFVHVVLVG
jgi:L-lactate dehydrogenase complex protein LldG